jgi:uncharacterized protein YoxC
MINGKLEECKAIIGELNELAIRIQELNQKKNELSQRLQKIRDTLPKIEEEEKVKLELYTRMGIEYKSKLQNIKREEEDIERQISQVNKESRELSEKFLNLFLKGGYPYLDLENPEVSEARVVFPIKESFRFLSATYEVLLTLTWNRREPFINDVKFEEDKWIVNAHSQIEAMRKVNDVLSILEESTHNILNIDKICERINKAKKLSLVLQLLYNAGALPLNEIAKQLGWKTNYAGAILTNLMKKKPWPIPLIERPDEGIYQLNGHGYIIMRRYEQLYGITTKKEQCKEASQLVGKKTLKNFLKI